MQSRAVPLGTSRTSRLEALDEGEECLRRLGSPVLPRSEVGEIAHVLDDRAPRNRGESPDASIEVRGGECRQLRGEVLVDEPADGRECGAVLRVVARGGRRVERADD